MLRFRGDACVPGTLNPAALPARRAHDRASVLPSYSLNTHPEFDGEEGRVSIRFTGPLPCAQQRSRRQRPEVTVLRRRLFCHLGETGGATGQGWTGRTGREG